MNSMIKVENVTKKFGDDTILENITIDFEKGKIYGIIGRNGSGKTVLFKLIIGFLKPTRGRILVEGKEIGKDIDFAQVEKQCVVGTNGLVHDEILKLLK